MNFIYDRTQSDVDYAINNQNSAENLKGSYNYTDLNRVESNCETIANLLNSYNYHVTITVKTDWSMADFPTVSDMERIRSNVNALKEAYYSFTNIPISLQNITYHKANDIERILSEIDVLIDKMIADFRACGTFSCNGMEGLI